VGRERYDLGFFADGDADSVARLEGLVEDGETDEACCSSDLGLC